MDTFTLKEVVELLERGFRLAHPLDKGHGGRTAEIARLMARQLTGSKRMEGDDLLHLEMGARLHDIGDIFIPEGVITKEGELSEVEKLQMRGHPVLGYKFIYRHLHKDMAEIVLHHHEHFDGSGYPDKLYGKAIPLMARIVTIADVYDALTHKRPYRAAYDRDAAYKIMLEMRNQFDPELFEIFRNVQKVLK